MPRVTKKGLGRYMMQIAELIARKYGLNKIILTVIKGTHSPLLFFQSESSYRWLLPFSRTSFLWYLSICACDATENKGALDFYKSKLKYVLDETDPSEEGRAESFEILSKTLVRALPPRRCVSVLSADFLT